MQIFAGKSKWKHVGFLLLAVFMIGFLGGEAQANPNWKALQGYSVCGGIDRSGRLQEPCEFEKATFVSKALGTCPKGSFFNLGTWSCYSCPAGYNRNAKNIDGDKACDKAVPPQTRSAKFEGKKECPAGSILDPRNGGECWQCPSGFGRTAAAVDKYNACGRIGKKATSAVFRGRSCSAEGSFGDPRNGGECWSCPEGFNRTGNTVTGNRACKKVLDFKPAVKLAALTCQKGQHFDFIDGGTCWSCPANTDRTIHGVKSSKACRNKKMQWATPPRKMYGLFGLGTAVDEVLAELIANRDEIDALVIEAAENGKVSKDKALAAAWKLIDTKPWESSYLHTVLAKKVIDAAQKPVSKRSPVEKSLLSTVANLFQWNRQFIAYQAKQAHETWVAAGQAFYNKRAKEMGAAIVYSDNMIVPLDYNELVASTVQGAATGSMVGSVSIGMFLPKFAYMFPYRSFAIKAISAAGSNPSAFITGGGGSGLLGSTGAAGAVAAPIAITLAIGVIVTMEIDKFAKTQKAEGEIRQSIDIANRPVDIALMLQQKNGKEEFWLHWSTVLSGSVKPSANFKARLAAFKSGQLGAPAKPNMPTIQGGKPLTTSPATLPTSSDTITQTTSVPLSNGRKWVQVEGTATDIAHGADGTTYIVSTEKHASGFKIYKRGRTANNWSAMSSGATRIAASGGKAWIINNVGNVFVQLGVGWVPVRAPLAQDIGASSKGVWLVGRDGRIYQRVGNGWQPADGAAHRVDVDADGRPWVVTRKGNVFVHGNNLKWQLVAGTKASDVSVDGPENPHIVGTDGKIYTRDKRFAKWTAISQTDDIQAIAIGNGRVWSVNAANKIFSSK